MNKDAAEKLGIGHLVRFRGETCQILGRGRNRLGNPTFTFVFRGHQVTVSYAQLDNV